MGRNEDGRIPYFKTGIYNAAGEAQRGEVWIREFAYNCSAEPCAESSVASSLDEEKEALNQLNREAKSDIEELDENDVLSRSKRAKGKKNKKERKEKKERAERKGRKRDKVRNGLSLEFELHKNAPPESCLLKAYGKAVYTNLERELTKEMQKEDHNQVARKLVEVLKANDRRADILENTVRDLERGVEAQEFGLTQARGFFAWIWWSWPCKVFFEIRIL